MQQSIILFENKNWSIRILPSNDELIISNNWSCSYAYLNRKTKQLFFDRIVCPKYIQKIALSKALKSSMKDIYND